MTSIIDDQSVDIQQLLAPLALNLGTTGSQGPTLPPLAGSLGYDPAVPGVFVGNGSTWLGMGAGINNAISSFASAVSFSSTGNAGVSGTVSIFLMKVGTNTVKMISVDIVQTVSITGLTGGAIWVSPPGVVGSLYLPLKPPGTYYGALIPIVMNLDAGTLVSSYMLIGANGQIQFALPANSNSAMTVANMSGVYV